MHAERRNNIKSFAIKLPESNRFLGMPSRKNWILYAQQLDPFGVKNWLGFNISRGTGEYASSTQFVEVARLLMMGWPVVIFSSLSTLFIVLAD